MNQFNTPKRFYSSYNPKRIMVNPIQFWVRGKIDQWGHKADHVEFFTLDASEKEALVELINALLAKRDDGVLVINGQEMIVTKVGEGEHESKELPKLQSEIITWHAARIAELPQLKRTLNEYLNLFKRHSNLSRSSFWKSPSEPLKAVKNALKEAIKALNEIKDFEALIKEEGKEETSFANYSQATVKDVSKILSDLKNTTIELANNPVLQTGDLGETVKNFANEFEFKLPKIGLGTRLSSAVENIQLTVVGCNKR